MNDSSAHPRSHLLRSALPCLAALVLVSPLAARQDPIAHWTFDGANPGEDTSGSHHGTLQGGATTSTDVPPIPGNVAALDVTPSNTAILRVPHASDLNFATGQPRSLSLWVKPLALQSSYHILGKRTGCTGTNFHFQLARGQTDNLSLASCAGACGAVLLGGDLATNEWVQLAVTYDGSLWTGYRNGARVEAIGSPFHYLQDMADLILGNSGTCVDGFYGLIDDVRIYDRALSAAEVAALAQLPSGTCYAGSGTGMISPPVAPICFPEGDISFADVVLRYDPGGNCVPSSPDFVDPHAALGPPDIVSEQLHTGVLSGAVSLGEGGVIELGFLDNHLCNSGDALEDVHVFEVAVAESSFLALRPADTVTAMRLDAVGVVDANGDGFYEFGSTGGLTSSVDLDALAPGYAQAELRFDAVQIMDDPTQQLCDDRAGADIDGVGAGETALAPPLGSTYCSPAVPNSTGLPGAIVATGSVEVADNALTVLAFDVPPGQFGYFLTSQTQGMFMPPASQGFICVTTNIGRYQGNVGQGPSFSLEIDLASMPVNPHVAALPGETWNFQAWYRDVGNTSNFTDAVAVTLQ